MSEIYKGGQQQEAATPEQLTTVESAEEKDNSFPFDGGIIVFGHGFSKPIAEGGGGWRLSPEAFMRAVGAYQL